MRPGNETTVEEWEKRFSIDAKRRPGWSVLPIEMLFSQAYRSLTGSAQLALLFALSQVSWEKTRRPGKRKNLKNDTIYLPTNALIALGIKSGSTRTALRKDLVAKGFLDVKKSGSYLNCGVFRLSGRWRHYPNGAYRPQDQPPAGISMGHRFRGKSEEEDASEDVFLRSEIKRKEDSIIERKGYPEKTHEEDLLRLKIERKGLRSKIERTVLCTKRSGDQGEEESTDPSRNLISSIYVSDSQDIPSESIQLKHQWFLDAFKEACSQKGIEVDLRIDASLASTLDDWIFKRLSKKSYFGNRCFYEEKPYNIQEKVSQIVSQWEFIEISYLGERVSIPSSPDLNFLITYREQIFSWVSEVRQRSMDAVLAQLDKMGQAASAGYTH